MDIDSEPEVVRTLRGRAVVRSDTADALDHSEDEENPMDDEEAEAMARFVVNDEDETDSGDGDWVPSQDEEEDSDYLSEDVDDIVDETECLTEQEDVDQETNPTSNRNDTHDSTVGDVSELSLVNGDESVFAVPSINIRVPVLRLNLDSDEEQ